MAIVRPLTPDSHLILVDGSGYIFRAHHALPPLMRKSDGMFLKAGAQWCIRKTGRRRAAYQV